MVKKAFYDKMPNRKRMPRDKERITYTYIYMIVWPLYDGGNNGFGCCFLNGTTMIEDENNCWRLFASSNNNNNKKVLDSCYRVMPLFHQDKRSILIYTTVCLAQTSHMCRRRKEAIVPLKNSSFNYNDARQTTHTHACIQVYSQFLGLNARWRDR